ncbi:CoA pyrophosphatase [Nitrincola sp. MINF-07-Sa-05]|uniref:CoA pyrophosphatase n=1 Tax=Nitrincola salilacus TaxID=3400273 RepID=UPI0039183499
MLDQVAKRLKQYRPWRLRAQGMEAAVLVVMTDQVHDPEIVLTVRSHLLSTHRGEVAFPGGKRDPEDADLLHTALREAEEEIGLSQDKVQIIGSLGQVVSKHQLQVTPWVGVIPSQLPLRPNPGELDKVFKVPVSFFLENEAQRMDSFIYEGRTHRISAWEYDGEIIWGLTAYILTEFLNVGFGAGLNIPPRPERLAGTVSDNVLNIIRKDC